MNTNSIKFISKENPTENEVMELRLNLRAFNENHTEGYERLSLIHQIRNEKGILVGGIYGTISWNWLYIDLLWIDESIRGAGNGKILIQAIEQNANGKGVFSYRLATTIFQALNFYKKMGYQICGKIQDLPPGHTNYFLIKTDI